MVAHRGARPRRNMADETATVPTPMSVAQPKTNQLMRPAAAPTPAVVMPSHPSTPSPPCRWCRATNNSTVRTAPPSSAAVPAMKLVRSRSPQSPVTDSAISVAIRHHHEWWDGRGYGDGLFGEQIPLPARIVAIADAYDAMTCDRPYRKALPAGAVVVELEKYAGVQFDPTLTHEFVRIVQSSEVELSVLAEPQAPALLPPEPPSLPSLSLLGDRIGDRI